MKTLTQECLSIRHINATAAGTSAVNGAAWQSMAGYDSVRAVALIGALTATQVTSLKIQEADDSSGTNARDITGAVTAAMADGDSNKMLIVEAARPQKAYVRATISRGTANAVVDGCVLELFNARVAPVTADSTVSAQKVVLAD